MPRIIARLCSGLLLVVWAACGVATPAAPTLSTIDADASAANTPAPASATPAQGQTTLTVFAAASLTEAFSEIGKQFDALNGTTTTFNFAGSQQLAQQIEQDAPADVFASANRAQLERVISNGHIITGTQQIFARNRLAVITPLDNPAQINKLEDLARPGVKLVFAAKEVPVGQYALDFLAKAATLPQFTASYSPTVLMNVVSYEENVRAVLSKVVLGEADAAIVYRSDVARDASNIRLLDIPDQLNTVASYPIAPLSTAPNAALAERFVAFVLSAAGQHILSSYGLLPVKP